MRFCPISVAVVLCAQGAPAQVTADVTVVQQLVTLGSGASASTLGPGPIPASGAFVTSGTSNRASIGIWPHDGFSTILRSPPPGLVGWRVGGGLDIHYAFGTPGSASMSGAVRVRFTSAHAVSGALVLIPDVGHYGDYTTLVDNYGLDMDCDGQPEYLARAGTSSQFEVPVTIGPAGLDVCVILNLSVHHQGTMNWRWENTRVSRSWDVIFVPSAYGVEKYATGCVRLWTYRSWVGFGQSAYVGPDPSAPSIAVGFFLVGLAPQNSPLPYAPFCSQFVASPALVLPTHQPYHGRHMGLGPLPPIVLPPGLQVHLQGIYLDQLGGLQTSHAVRTF